MGEIGVCDDNCYSCPRYMATIKDEPSGLEKVADLWIRIGWREKGVPTEDLKCYGCSSVKWCRYDTIRS